MIKIKKEVRKMKDSDLIYYKYIDTLYNIDNAEININKPLLKLFNEYISSNTDFKYNKTYLDDSVEDFVHCINMFKNKRSFVEKTKKELLKEYKHLQNWIIILDNIFTIDSLCDQTLLTHIIDCYDDNNTKYVLKNQLEQFNFYSMNTNNIKIYYYNTETGADFAQMLNIDKPFKLLDLVSIELGNND